MSEVKNEESHPRCWLVSPGSAKVAKITTVPLSISKNLTKHNRIVICKRKRAKTI